jgi:hypothetical protein
MCETEIVENRIREQNYQVGVHVLLKGHIARTLITAFFAKAKN